MFSGACSDLLHATHTLPVSSTLCANIGTNRRNEGDALETDQPVAVAREAVEPELGAAIDMRRISALAERSAKVVAQLRSDLLPPEARKTPPLFSTAKLGALCGIDKSQVAYRVSKGDLPAGQLTQTKSRREFSIDEVRHWARAYRKVRMRPAGQRALAVAIANFKGGSGKSTTAMVCAQGLSIRGHRVLVIDTDPQGSLTTLNGILPETEVTPDMSIMPLCTGESTDIRPSIRSTYWAGIDIVCASPQLFSAEFELPARQMEDPEVQFWNALNTGLEPVRDLYDVIVIDTPPALGYVTLNALWAADGIVVPIPPNGLDFASLAQFWSLLADLGQNLDEQEGRAKQFAFLKILMSRVDQADAATAAVREWILSTYGEFVMPVEIPRTTVTATKSAEFGTIYDVEKYDGSAKTFSRAYDAYDRFVELVEDALVATWRKRAAA